jgi:phosphatidylserine synthase
MNYFMCSLTETEMFAVLAAIFLIGTIAIKFLQSIPWMKMKSFGVVGQIVLIGALALWYTLDPCSTVN